MTRYTIDQLNRVIAASDVEIGNPEVLSREPRRMQHVQSERELQRQVFQECAARAVCNPAWSNVACWPNGLVRPNTWEPGISAGVPDIVVFLQRRGYGGMMIELKVGRNKTTPAQEDWIERLRANGYYVSVIYDDIEEVLVDLEWFIEGDE